MEKLKPCPFCGNDGEIDVFIKLNQPRYAPECTFVDCLIFESGRDYPSEEQAIEAWNTRAGDKK